jgi:hypothetical protein
MNSYEVEIRKLIQQNCLIRFRTIRKKRQLQRMINNKQLNKKDKIYSIYHFHLN